MPIRTRTVASKPITSLAASARKKRPAGIVGHAPLVGGFPLPHVLPGGLERGLLAGTRLRRSEAPEGKEHLLSPHEVDRLRQLLPRLPVQAEAIAAALERLEGEGAAVAKALVLRATHARLTRLLGGDGKALDQILRFARELVGLDSDTLRLRATVLDLDSRLNSSDRDPMAIANRRGVIHDPAPDRRADNDGLFQLYTGSCGPTVVQMMLAEADPILAFALHKAGMEANGPEALAAAFQGTLLEHYAGVAVLQADSFRWARFRNALAKLHKDPALDEGDLKSLLRFVNKKSVMSGKAAKAIAEMRARFDFPNDAELKALRARPIPKRDAGIGGDDLEDALRRHLTPLTGIEYRMAGEQVYARGRPFRWLDQVARTLAEGIDVPFGISEPSHWMMLSAVSGRKPDRSFLVSDPLGGRTAWVHEAELKSGAFVKKQFDLTTGHERGYIDCFLLPVR